MIRHLVTALLLLTTASALFAAAKVTQPPAPALPGTSAAKQVPKSPAVRFAEEDVARLKELAAKNVKLAPRLTNAEARLKLLSGKPLGDADPKNIHLLETLKHDRPMISCRFSADGHYVFGGAMDSSLHRWELTSGGKTDLPGHESWIRRFDVHPDGKLLVTGAYAGRLIWWNPSEASPKPMRTVEAHKGYVRGVAVSPNGQLVATCGNDLVVRIWSAVDGKLVAELPGHQRHIYNVRFDPSGQFLVSGDLMGVLKQWDTATWKQVRETKVKELIKYDTTFKADIGGFRGMDFSPDGKYLVVCGIGKVSNAFAGIGEPTAVLFDFNSGKKLRVLTPAKSYKGTMWSVRFHPSGKFIVGSGGGSGMLWFWKPDSAKSFHALKTAGCAYDVAFHPDGFRMAVATYLKAVTIYDLGPKPTTKKPTKRTRGKRRRKK